MFSADVLKIDCAKEAERIQATMKEQVLGTLSRRGLVVGVSGGIDSAVVVALAARALGKGRVLALFMPERDSSGNSLRLGEEMASSVGVDGIVEDMTPLLEGAGCYRRQDEAVRMVFPDYGPGWKCKIVLPSIIESARINVSRLTVQSPSGEVQNARMPAACYRQLVAATNFKQRTRKMMEYYHADRLGYAVAGTPNRLEYDQGFFVKQGDGAADVKPIAHLYKTQIYALAKYLEVVQEIQDNPPTTDTFSMEQTQEEFFFSLPYGPMDLCLYGFNHDVPAEEVAPAVQLTPEQVERVYADIVAKRRTTQYLHRPPLLVEPVRKE